MQPRRLRRPSPQPWPRPLSVFFRSLPLSLPKQNCFIRLPLPSRLHSRHPFLLASSFCLRCRTSCFLYASTASAHDAYGTSSSLLLVSCLRLHTKWCCRSHWF